MKTKFAQIRAELNRVVSKRDVQWLGGAALLGLAGTSGATSLIDWSTLATGVTGEATSAITAGIGVLALFLGVAAGVRMFRKFIG